MKNETKGIYILLEKASSSGPDTVYSYDCMGYTHNEADAMKWRDENYEYRTYKYCWNTCKDSK